jgi:hypothetical protein
MPNPVPTTYDFKKVVLTFGGVPIDGYAEGSVINVEASDGEEYKKKVGADGEVSWSKSNNNTHKVTITLKQSSTSNAYLSSIHNTDRETGKAIFPLGITDLNGTSKQFWPHARIIGDPAWGYGADETDRQWVFDTAQIAQDERGGVLP